MKIGFIGDVHIGSGLNLGKTDPTTQLNSRLLDYAKTFDGIIDNFFNKGVKIIVIVGDFFENRNPTSSQLNIFSKCILRATKKEMKILMVVGNHDQQRTTNSTTVDYFNSLEIANVFVFSDIGTYTIDDNGQIINFIILPYKDSKMLDVANCSEAVEKLKNKIQDLRDNLNGIKILAGHLIIDKLSDKQDGENFSMSEIVLPLEVFDGLDAVVMGHVHRHTIIKKSPLIMNIGSMEKTTFGEKDNKKVSAIFNTNDINNPEIINSPVRNLYEMSFDYAIGDKIYKQEITDKIVEDISAYHEQNDLKDAIVRLVVKVKDCDLCYINHDRLKEFILGKGVSYLTPVQISTIGTRQLRNRNITEDSTGKQAMESFINNLKEPDATKKKLLKYANTVIEEVEGK